MAARQFYYAESTGESTTTSTSEQTKATLTFTPDASSDYYLFWSALVARSATAACVFADLYDGTSQLGITAHRPVIANDYISTGGIARHQSGGSPGSTSFTIRYKDESGSTAKIKEAHAFAIKADGSEKYTETLSAGSTNSNSFQDGATLTDTFSSGDYIIIASAELTTLNNAVIAEARLLVDGVALAATIGSPQMSTSMSGAAIAVQRVTLSGSKTIKWQYRRTTVGATAMGIKNQRILVLPVSAFDNVYTDQDSTRVTYSASTAYQDGSVLTQTPLALDHLLIGFGMLDASNLTNGIKGQVLEGATVIAEMTGTQTAAYTRPLFTISKRTLAASSTTWKTQYGTANTGTTVGFADSFLGVLQLDATPGGSTSLTLAEAGHAHAADNVTLTQVHALTVQDATHGHATDGVTLTQVHALTVQEAGHAHAADALTLAQVHALTVAEALHAHAADQVTVALGSVLAIADALHGHAADGVTLSQLHVLALQGAVHGHTADGLALAQVHGLSVADALHGHTAALVTITYGVVATPIRVAGQVLARRRAAAAMPRRGDAPMPRRPRH